MFGGFLTFIARFFAFERPKILSQSESIYCVISIWQTIMAYFFWRFTED